MAPFCLLHDPKERRPSRHRGPASAGSAPPVRWRAPWCAAWVRIASGSWALLSAAMERITVYRRERTVPAGLGRKMLHQVEHMFDRHEWLGQCLRGRVVRPVNDQRFPDNIVARDKAPVAAVERGIAIVAHREI